MSKPCTRCGMTGLVWGTTPRGGYFLRDPLTGLPHTNTDRCVSKPVTSASDLRPTSRAVKESLRTDMTLSEEFAGHAKAAVMDAVADAMAPFHRSLSSALEANDNILAKTLSGIVEAVAGNVDLVLKQAKEEFRLLMPQQHEIVLRTPKSTTTLESRPHYQLEHMLSWLNLREHVMAAGPAGSGKTTAAEQAASLLGLPSKVVPCGMGTNDWSLLGFINPQGNYVPGQMRSSYEHGGVFILDELDNTNPSVLVTINSALSGKSYEFPDGHVKMHPDFVVVGCANTWGSGPDRMYVGRNQLDVATLDRFIKVPWEYDEDAEFEWAGRDQILWVEYVQRVRACARNLSMRVVVSPRASIKGAKGLRNGLSYRMVSEDCIWNGMNSDDVTRIVEIVGGINV